MESLNKLGDIIVKLATDGYYSYDHLRYLKDANFLDKILEENNMFELLRNDFNEFFSILFNTNYPYYLKNIKLEEMMYGFTYDMQFVLCLYCNSEAAYRNLPLLFKKLIEKLDLYEYSTIPINTIKARMYDAFNIKEYDNQNLNKNVFEIKGKIHNSKYDKYDNNYDFGSANTSNVEEFSVWGEHRALDEESILLTNYQQKPIWVARYNGDGFGFDVYSHDTNTFKEKLIEAKTGERYLFSLTENEAIVMRNAHFYNAIFQINKYTFEKANQIILPEKYIYLPENDRIVDEYGEYYNLYRYRNNNNKIMYKVSHDEEYKPKTKIFI